MLRVLNAWLYSLGCEIVSQGSPARPQPDLQSVRVPFPASRAARDGRRQTLARNPICSLSPSNPRRQTHAPPYRLLDSRTQPTHARTQQQRAAPPFPWEGLYQPTPPPPAAAQAASSYRSIHSSLLRPAARLLHPSPVPALPPNPSTCPAHPQGSNHGPVAPKAKDAASPSRSAAPSCAPTPGQESLKLVAPCRFRRPPNFGGISGDRKGEGF